jgi:hypothetical protein
LRNDNCGPEAMGDGFDLDLIFHLDQVELSWWAGWSAIANLAPSLVEKGGIVHNEWYATPTSAPLQICQNQ